jgi:hypothetical protein
MKLGGRRAGGGVGFKLDEAKIRAKGDKTKTKQTVQLRTSKIHKTRRQAGRFLVCPQFVWTRNMLDSSIGKLTTDLTSLPSPGIMVSIWGIIPK